MKQLRRDNTGAGPRRCRSPPIVTTVVEGERRSPGSSSWRSSIRELPSLSQAGTGSRTMAPRGWRQRRKALWSGEAIVTNFEARKNPTALQNQVFRTEGTRGTTVPGRAIKATRLSNRLQPRATRSLRASLVHSLDQSPVHGGTVNKELLRTVTNTTRAAQQGAWATRFDLPPAPPCASGAFGMDTTRRHIEQLSVNGNFSVLMRHPDGATGFA